MIGLKSHIAVFAINIVMLAVLYWQIDHVDIEQQHRTLSEILRLETVELQLDREIFRLSSRHLNNYDSIADLRRQRNETLATLRQESVEAAPGSRLARLLAAVAASTGQSDREVDQILRVHASLRNSESYFPVLLDTLVARLDREEPGSEAGYGLYRLGEFVAAHTMERTEASRRAVVWQAERLHSNHGQQLLSDVDTSEDFDNALEHARIIATQTLQIRDMMESYFGLSIIPLAQEIYGLYRDRFVHQQERAESLFPLFHFVQVALVLHIVVLFATLVRTNRQITGQARALQLNLEREQELNGLQRQFVSMVSHEFRTPLTIIDAIAQRLLRRPEKATPERMRESLGKVRASVKGLVHLMESVLNVAKIEDGRIQVAKKTIDLRALVNEVAAGYREMSAEHQIAIEVDSLPETFYGDGTLLRQVVSNLVSNAVKYSPAGTGVTVSGEAIDGQARITVSDQGVGIPADEVERLFQRFFRASTSTGIPGSGIGLHLVQHLVELHDGRIAVESEVGKGTSFTVSLPIAEPDDLLADLETQPQAA